MFLLTLLILININSASLQQLDELTGVGPKYAQAIIDARPFASLDDLLKVKGIGPAVLQKIKTQGLACVDCLEIASSPEAPRNDAPVTYHTGIFINEILPNPKGSDETDEYIKLFNSNNFDVDLSDWQIQDTAGTPTTFTIPKDTKILANNFLVFKRPETKIMLNNEGDGLNLLTSDKKIIDSVNFTKAPLDQTYKKTSSGSPRDEAGWQWISKTLPKPKISAKNKPVKPELTVADLSQAINLNQKNNESSNPWFLFFSVLAVAIISAMFVLFVRFKFKNYKI